MFIKNAGKFKGYPIDRSNICTGDVSGKLSEWILSTDIGCALMGVDGLKITRRDDVFGLAHEMPGVHKHNVV